MTAPSKLHYITDKRPTTVYIYMYVTLINLVRITKTVLYYVEAWYNSLLMTIDVSKY